MALAGVWNFRGSNEYGGKTMLPDWDEVALDGRRVFVCFDSDCRLNPNVTAAMERLGRSLKLRGAEVAYVYLPANGDDGKVGVDDFLAADHTLSDVIELAEPEPRPVPSQAKPVKQAHEFEPYSLAGCEAVFREKLFLEDTCALRLVLAAVAVVMRVDGLPLWPLLVGPPSCGKTEILMSVEPHPVVRLTAKVSEPALLSGVSSKERTAEATGGVLRSLGERGVILLKDFTSTLEMRSEPKAEALAALREIYDGAWVRSLGTDGGVSLEWRGHAGFIAGVTPVIEDHHGVLSQMGDRFVLYRMPELDTEKVALQALRQHGRVDEMRGKLADAACGVLAAIPENAQARGLTEEEEHWLVVLANLATLLRSAVARDRHSREVVRFPKPEVPARFALTLRALLDGLDLIGCTPDEAREIVEKVSWGSIPEVRRLALQRLLKAEDSLKTAEVLAALPTGSGRRVLEDLTALGLVVRHHGGGQGKTDHWELSRVARELLERAGSEPQTRIPEPFPQSPPPSSEHASPAPTDPYIGGGVKEETLRKNLGLSPSSSLRFAFEDRIAPYLRVARDERPWERAFVERHQPGLDRELLGTILYSADDEADAERQAQEWRAATPNVTAEAEGHGRVTAGSQGRGWPKA